MNILVTGGCGYVGSVLVPRLLALGHRITVVDALWFGNFLKPHSQLLVQKEDIRNADNISMKGFDAVIHLANVANDPCSDLSPKLSWEVNALATMQLVEKAVKEGVAQFIYASSGSVYGVKEEPEVTEDLSLVPISDYNKTKMVSERVLLSYQDKICVKIVRPATVCGLSPRMRLDLSVNLLAMQALSKKRITVFGGTQTRPNIHINDMADVYVHMLELGNNASGIYNAGFENISIMDIARKVSEYIPSDIVVSESNDPRSYRLSSKKLLSTGFKQKYSVMDAISEIASAYKVGQICDEDKWYNIKSMKTLNLNNQL